MFTTAMQNRPNLEPHRLDGRCRQDRVLRHIGYELSYSLNSFIRTVRIANFAVSYRIVTDSVAGPSMTSTIVSTLARLKFSRAICAYLLFASKVMTRPLGPAARANHRVLYPAKVPNSNILFAFINRAMR